MKTKCYCKANPNPLIFRFFRLLQSQPLKPNEEIPSVDLFEGSIPTTTINVCRGKKVIILVLLGTRDEITVSDKWSLVETYWW